MTSLLSLTNNYSAAGSDRSTELQAKINQALLASNKPLTALNAAVTKDTTTLSGLGQLRSAMTSLYDAAQSVTGGGLYTSVDVQNEKLISATASDAAIPGTYTIAVSQLAKGQQLISKSVNDKNSQIGSSAAVVRFEFGNSDGKNFIAGPASNRDITISATDNTLSGIADAINTANIGVKAQVVRNADNSYALSLSSPTGADNSLRISVTGDTTLQSFLTYNPDGAKALNQTVAAQNAAVTVDGKTFASANNKIANAISGLTLNLAATGETQLTVSEDTAQIAGNVKNFVDAYNSFSAKLNDLQQGDLKGDQAAASLKNQFAHIFNTLSSSGTSLSKIGVSISKNKLTVDTAKLQSEIDANPKQVAELLTGDGKGVVDKLIKNIQQIAGAKGSLQKETTALTREIQETTQQRDALQTVLTNKASALMSQYTQNSATNSGLSLFDYF